MLSTTLQNRIRKAISPVPARLSKRFKKLGEAGQQDLERVLKLEYFDREIWGDDTSASQYLASKEGQADLRQHLFERLDNFRSTVIPWLDSTVGLSGKEVLEIGCGTGTSTIALAEQGARVTAIEIDEKSLLVAKERCRLYDVEAGILQINGADAAEAFKDRKFDVIVYMAVIEHMTIEERLKSLRECWTLLNPNGHLVVAETPNRLWLYDAHTAWLPFYFWLPDDLAYLYSVESSRIPFNTTFVDKEYKRIDEFRRQGRGVSFHEFEIALGKRDSWRPLMGLRDFLRRRSPLWWIAHALTTPLAFQRSLKKAAPHVPDVFFEQSLDLVIQKT